MNQEHETQPMRSTNFEFLRAKAQRLSDLGAIIESHIHDSPADAIADLRRYAEFLLHEFVERKGREGVKTRGDHGQHRTIEFSTLIGECSDPKKPWHVPTQQLQWFKDIKNAGDPATHDRTYEARETLRLLNTAWNLSAWVAQELGWERPRDAFAEPQRGGEELAELRSQRDEAARRAAGLPIDLSRWAAKQSIAQFRAKKFTGRDWVYRRIEQFLDQDEKRVLVIQGDPGRGKSGVMAQFLDEHLPIETTACWHFFVDSQGEPRDWICRFYSVLLSPDELKLQEPHLANGDQTALLREFRHRLGENAITSQKQLVFVIDAVDEAGPSKEAVAEFLRSEFPPNVRVLATVRPTHFDASRCSLIDVFDFEHPDVRNDHRNDGLAFVRAIAPANLSDDALRAIGEIGNGNFLVLSLICQELPSSALEVETYLQQLRNLDQSAPKLYEELFQRAWKRLRRLSHEALRNVYQTLALLAVCRQPLTSEMIKGVLKFETSDWDKLIDNVGEYVREDITHFDGTQTEVFRLFHATFADFVSLKLKSDVRRMELKLATICRDWIHEAPTEFERAYALRFVIHHFVHAQAWKEVDALLTDLQFIQARFEAGQGHDLLAEYDAVLKAHPQQDKEFKQRIEQDAALHQYVQDIVEYSRHCTEIRNRHERSEYGDPIAEINQLKFPEPPDTTQTIKDMRRTEARQKNPAAHKPAKPTGFTRIRDFQQFVVSERDLLSQAPHATVDLARNYSSDRETYPSQEQQSKRSTASRLLRNIVPSLNEHCPLIACTVTTDVSRSTAPWGKMTPDARRSLVGHFDGDLPYDFQMPRMRSVSDTQSGRVIHHYKDGNVLDLSCDGRWALVESMDSIRLLDIDRPENNGLELSGQRHPHATHISPDGKLVVLLLNASAFQSSDQPGAEPRLVIWNTTSNHITHIPFSIPQFDDAATSEMSSVMRDINPELHVAASGATAFVLCANSVVVVDLVKHSVVGLDSIDELNESEFQSEWVQCVRLHSGLETPNGEVRVLQSTFGPSAAVKIVDKNDNDLRSFGNQRPFECIHSLSADGRYALATAFGSLVVLDLAHGTYDAGQTADDENHNQTEHSNYCGSSDHQTWHVDLGLIADHDGAHITLADDETDDLVVLPTEAEHDLLSPDASFLVQYPERSYDDWMKIVDHSHLEIRSDEGEISAALFDFSTDVEVEIEGPEDFLGVSPDEKSLMFRELSEDGQFRMRYWSIQQEDWWHETERTHTSLCRTCANNLWSDESRNKSMVLMSGVVASPDGRSIVLETGEEELVSLLQLSRAVHLDEGWLRQIPNCLWSEQLLSICFSPDGQVLILTYEEGVFAWSITDRQAIGIAKHPSRLERTARRDWVNCDGQLLGQDGEQLGLRIEIPNRGPAWVTGARLFQLASRSFDDEITYRCRRCHKRQQLPADIEEVIHRIHRERRLEPGQSPVLELPDDAWDDEPKLDFECPHCHQPHRSTPFYFDRRASS